MQTANTAKSLPLVLQLAINGLDRLHSVFNARRERGVRPERFYAIKLVATAILRHTDLSRNGACMRFVKAGTVAACYPCSVPFLAKETGLDQRRVERCLQELKEVKFLQAPKQIIKPIGQNKFRVHTVRRALTPIFWEILGLTSQYLHDCGHAAMKCVDSAMKELVSYVRVSGGRYRKCAAPKPEEFGGAVRDDPPRPKTQAEIDGEREAFVRGLERGGDFAAAKAIRAMWH